MFDYLVEHKGNRLYLPCLGQVCTMLGAWFYGSLYQRLPNSRGKFLRGECSLEERTVTVTVKYRHGAQTVKLFLYPGVGVREFGVTFRHAVKSDFVGYGAVSVVVQGFGNG